MEHGYKPSSSVDASPKQVIVVTIFTVCPQNSCHYFKVF